MEVYNAADSLDFDSVVRVVALEDFGVVDVVEVHFAVDNVHELVHDPVHDLDYNPLVVVNVMESNWMTIHEMVPPLLFQVATWELVDHLDISGPLYYAKMGTYPNTNVSWNHLYVSPHCY